MPSEGMFLCISLLVLSESVRPAGRTALVTHLSMLSSAYLFGATRGCIEDKPPVFPVANATRKALVDGSTLDAATLPVCLKRRDSGSEGPLKPCSSHKLLQGRLGRHARSRCSTTTCE